MMKNSTKLPSVNVSDIVKGQAELAKVAYSHIAPNDTLAMVCLRANKMQQDAEAWKHHFETAMAEIARLRRA